MSDYITLKTDGSLPILASAIHNGHKVRKNILGNLAIHDSGRLREEDPFTGIWTNLAGNRIVVHHSRFEFDLNRPPEKAVYILPEDAWGLKVWNHLPTEEEIASSRALYSRIYQQIHDGLSYLVRKFGKLVVYDLHSYNYRRMGPECPPEDPAMNPEINIGTGTMDREYWAPLIDRFINDLKGYEFMNRFLDVRENVKFKGGYFPGWIHKNFGRSVCCISIEIKKFFMDEWTGVPDNSVIQAIGEAFRATVPGVIDQLSMLMEKHEETHWD
jgi:N-formylglutamate amidohydrolase